MVLFAHMFCSSDETFYSYKWFLSKHAINVSLWNNRIWSKLSILKKNFMMSYLDHDFIRIICLNTSFHFRDDFNFFNVNLKALLKTSILEQIWKSLNWQINHTCPFFQPIILHFEKKKLAKYYLFFHLKVLIITKSHRKVFVAYIYCVCFRNIISSG